jgi:glycosyltransferase involved in cell wall biosynthesis
VTESAPAERRVKVKGGKTVLLALSAAFGAPGGIEMYGRLLIKASIEIAGETGGRSAILILNDSPADVDARYTSGHAVSACSGSRFRFVASLVRLVLAVRPDVIIFGLVNFGSLSLLTRPLCPRSEHWFVAYGIEVWRRLPAIRRAALRRAERVLAISGFTGREAVAHNGLDPARVSLLACALDPVWAEGHAEEAHRASADPGQTLLTVARLASWERYKGVEQVLRALPEIARCVPEVRYVVVGDGDDRSRLEALATELGMSSVVEFRGGVDGDSLGRAYAECSLFIMPSRREGFGIVFLEAGYFGKPSVAGHHGASPEVVKDGETGLLVEQDDIAGIARSAITLLEQTERREELGRAARALVLSHYTFERLSERLRDLLDE